MKNGACGVELWIADELWRLARKSPSDYHGFVMTVALMLTVGEKKPRRPYRSRAERADVKGRIL